MRKMKKKVKNEVHFRMNSLPSLFVVASDASLRLVDGDRCADNGVLGLLMTCVRCCPGAGESCDGLCPGALFRLFMLGGMASRLASAGEFMFEFEYARGDGNDIGFDVDGLFGLPGFGLCVAIGTDADLVVW